MRSHSDGNTPRVPDLPEAVTLEPAEAPSPAAPAGEAAASPEASPASRGRAAGYPTPPAQIPACRFPAPGSSVTLASALSLQRQVPSVDADIL
jgi:hypothetical protein